MKILCSIIVKKIRNKPEWIVMFGNRFFYIKEGKENPIIGQKATRFNSAEDANTFARNQFYRMDCMPDKFNLEIKYYDEWKII